MKLDPITNTNDLIDIDINIDYYWIDVNFNPFKSRSCHNVSITIHCLSCCCILSMQSRNDAIGNSHGGDSFSRCRNRKCSVEVILLRVRAFYTTSSMGPVTLYYNNKIIFIEMEIPDSFIKTVFRLTAVSTSQLRPFLAVQLPQPFKKVLAWLAFLRPTIFNTTLFHLHTFWFNDRISRQFNSINLSQHGWRRSI